LALNQVVVWKNNSLFSDLFNLLGDF